MDIVIPNENETKDEKKNEKYITIGIAIETEENDVKIGFIWGENDIDEQKIDVHI